MGIAAAIPALDLGEGQVARLHLRPLAACLLADVAWEAHPDFRAGWAVDMGVHGNWVGIDAEGRAMVSDFGLVRPAEGLSASGVAVPPLASVSAKAVRFSPRITGSR